MTTEIYRDRRDIKISKETDRRLEAFSIAVGEKAKSKSVERLLNSVGVVRNPDEIKVATFEIIMAEPAPTCIIGKPCSGKSYSLEKFLLQAIQRGYPVIVVDPSNEHFQIGKKVNTLNALNKSFSHGAWHIVLEKDPEQRRLSIDLIFQHLHTLALKGNLQGHIIAIDEAGSFAEVPAFRNFVTESRKHMRKMVVTSVEPKFSDICAEVRPLPREFRERTGSNEGVSQSRH